MYKFVASDLDGTLINELGEIPELNLNAIKKSRERGVFFCLASGRSMESLEHYEQKLNLISPKTYGISLNGAILYETMSRKVIRDIRIDKSLALSIIDMIRPFSMDIFVYIGNNLFAEQMTDYAEYYVKKTSVPVNIIHNFCDIESNVSKILIRGTSELLDIISVALLPATSGVLNLFRSDRTFLEVTAPEATKGSGILFLASLLGFNQAETIAIGDQENDISMIKAAGLGVAVQNAQIHIKQEAGYVTNFTNSEGAVSEVLDKFVLSI